MDEIQQQHIKMMEAKRARYDEHCKQYSEQLRLLGYIKSLEADNESIVASANENPTGKNKRRAKKLLKINNKDIEKYRKMLSKMPEVPEFKQ